MPKRKAEPHPVAVAAESCEGLLRLRYRAHKPLYLIVPKQSDMAGFRNRETVFDPGKVTGYVFRDGFMDGNRSRGTRHRETRIP